MKKVFLAFVAVGTIALVSCNNDAASTEETTETATEQVDEAPAAEETDPETTTDAATSTGDSVATEEVAQ